VDLSADGIVQSILYLKNLIGIEHIALGSDFDGSVTTPYDITGLPMIVDAMLKQDMTVDEINAVIGYNLRDFLLRSLPEE
jgi:microsomal dipeptidase-like Zn-dependent dipeptidase